MRKGPTLKGNYFLFTDAASHPLTKPILHFTAFINMPMYTAICKGRVWILGNLYRHQDGLILTKTGTLMVQEYYYRN